VAGVSGRVVGLSDRVAGLSDCVADLSDRVSDREDAAKNVFEERSGTIPHCDTRAYEHDRRSVGLTAIADCGQCDASVRFMLWSRQLGRRASRRGG
jgi:hypothetical protein